MSVAPPQHAPAPHKGDGLLRLIGIFKVLKGVGLIAVGISGFHLVKKDLGEVITNWAAWLRIAPGNRIVARLVERAVKVKPKQLIIAGWVMLGYAAMFLTEGTGLLLLKPWAEWMTVITTSALIPFEVYETWRRPTGLKFGAMALNVVIAIYLVIRVKRERSSKKSKAAGLTAN
jgi:uncharacterized membrane protein (DUF2068 family)